MKNDYSRLKEVEEKKNIKNAAIFGGLTILIIIFCVFFAIPLFSKLAGIGTKKGNINQNTNSTEILLPPNLSPIPKFTNKDSLIVKGTAKPNSTITIFVNNSPNQTSSDDSGNFIVNLNLNKGANTIYAKTSASGKESDNSTTYQVTFTTTQPNLTINQPANNQTFYGSSQKTINIEGQTDPEAQITINDRFIVVDNNGKFNSSIDLQNGDNNIKITATDQAGNKKEIDLKVTFNP